MRIIYRKGQARTDDEVLTEIVWIAPLAYASDAAWDDVTYWNDVAFRYIALSDVAARRKLRPAVPLLLERACNGDPGESMCGMRRAFEATFAPDWPSLADVCMELSATKRAGTRMWAINQLMILDDPRAKPVFERALNDESAAVRWAAATGLERLARNSG